MCLKITYFHSLGLAKWNYNKLEFGAPLINSDKTTDVLLLHRSPSTTWMHQGQSRALSQAAAGKNVLNYCHGEIFLHSFIFLIETPVISEANLL